MIFHLKFLFYINIYIYRQSGQHRSVDYRGGLTSGRIPPPAVKTIHVFKRQNYFKVQGNNFIAPNARFVYLRLISDAHIQRYANPKSIQMLKSLQTQNISKKTEYKCNHKLHFYGSEDNTRNW